MKLGQVKNYSGQTISLNQKIASFFGIGERDNGQKKIWLNADQWCVAVPSDLTNEEVTQLDKAMSNGVIVLGRELIPALEKDKSVKEKYAKIIADARYLDEEIKDPFRYLVRAKQDGNYTALEIITYVLEQERSTRSRPNFMQFLQEAINHYDGPAFLIEDYPEDPNNYTVSVDLDNMTVVEDSRKENLISKQNNDYTPTQADNLSKQHALDELFGPD